MAYVSKSGSIAAFTKLSDKPDDDGNFAWGWTMLGEAEDTIKLEHGTVLLKGTSRNLADKGAAKDQRFRLFPILVPAKWTVAGLRDLLAELTEHNLGILASKLLDSLYSGLPLRFDDDVWVDVVFGKVSQAKVMEYATTNDHCLQMMIAGRRDEALTYAREQLETGQSMHEASAKDCTADDAQIADALYRKHCS